MFYVTGDIHGDAYDFLDRVDRDIPNATEGDTLLCLGDVGLGYGRFRGWELLKQMRRFPGTVVVMRGNHDIRYGRDLASGAFGVGDAHETKWCGGRAWVDPCTPNIVYLADEGGLYTIGRNGMKCLVIPGAFSVDKEYRLATGSPYEPEEQLTCSEMVAIVELARGDAVDYVFSHTCPLSWEPEISDLFLEGMDQSAVDKGTEKALDVVYDEVKGTCRAWMFGHYHDDRAIRGTCGRMLFHNVVRVPDLS